MTNVIPAALLAAGGFDLTDVMKVVFAVLALVAAFGAVVTLIAMFDHTGVFDIGYRWVVRHRYTLTVVVSTGAMLGSLYFSEVAHFTPCRLCWLQRYFMYWIAIVGLVGIVMKDRFRRAYRWFALGMASIGILISIQHNLVERGVVSEGTSCDPYNPCSLIWFQTFGFVTIPVMALCAFFAIIVFNVVPPRTTSSPEVTS